MNVVDSSGWLAFFSGSPNATIFAEPIRRTEELVVPTITITEVFKKILQQAEEHAALQAVAHMQQGRVISLDLSLAIEAARLGRLFKLPLADSVILATARAYDAMLWTQDEDFKAFPGVRFVPHRDAR